MHGTKQSCLDTTTGRRPEQNLNIKEDIIMNNEDTIRFRLSIKRASEGVRKERGMQLWH